MCTQQTSLIERGIKQGCLISCNQLMVEALKAIQEHRAVYDKRQKPITADHLLLVLSQDCDISQSNDPYIELLAIKKIKPKDREQKLQKSRNFRKLQLLINGEYWLCDADLISIIPKKILLNEKLDTGNLDHNALALVLDWRIGRYKRRPLPDKFNQDFLFGYLKNPDVGLDTFLQEYNNEIIDLYVFVNPADDDNATTYLVSVTALLSQDCPPELEQHIAETLFAYWKTLHEQTNSLQMMQVDPSLLPSEFLENGPPQNLTLKMSDFTLWDATMLQRITLDYLCYDDAGES